MTSQDDSRASGVLDRLGVDPLPEPAEVMPIPALPSLPVMPGLDPLMLVQPIIELLATFGAGALGGDAAAGPASTHQQIAQVLSGGIDALLGAGRSLDGGWLGQAATSAITAATRTAGESGLLAAQGTGMSLDLQVAGGIVAAGALQLQGVVVKTAGLLAAALPAAVTPPGQVAALAIAAEGLAEGLAVVGATRAQLVAPTASMTANGTPVPITGSPGGDGFGAAAKLLESALPLVQAGAQLVTSLLAGAGVEPGTEGIDDADQPGAVSGAPVGAGVCAPTCDRGSPTAATSGAPTSTSASHAGTKPTVGSVATSVGVPAPEPTPLAERPTTTNASVVGPPNAVASAAQVTPAGTGTAMPMAPMAPTMTRAASEAPREALPIPVVTTASDQPVEPGWLTTRTTESLDFDVALALGLETQDLAGSA
ncbi:hypothetical protein [Gordonia sp. (in: high G+C Gram-positive bacteria)]|uniref:hypothetical protein n=1 Tax=Gordonia sp. (in: high G+C Gram-positive bacteria) TaxID=84139 RepID=UPI00169E492F|nr:hypothetical protein [Gordonia sp. (in: high G+C Gram-positive bacteria)]NLG45471.1 hypothetical protein [Gordonia sp. (in: high G+C Gram-positive bacteria)]